MWVDLRAAGAIVVAVPRLSGSSPHSEVTCLFDSYVHASCSEKVLQTVPWVVDLVVDLAVVDSLGRAVLNVQAYPHCSVVNVPLWGTGMGHYLRAHVVGVVEDVHSLMVGVDVAVVVDQASKN